MRAARKWMGIVLALGLAALQASADSREDIESKSGVALGELRDFAPGVDGLLNKARGVLVFPDIVNMGFGVGGNMVRVCCG
jgi:lipid-binding SYLF domain-containing protein